MRKQRNMNNPHSWINYPNQGTRKCTKCGCIKRCSSSKGTTTTSYELNNIVSNDYVECPVPKESK